jgi:hypothetical protein
VQAADLASDDPRWVLAQSVAANLEHGRAAVLPPEKRARLITHAHRLGLRSFDASLVIALVQSRARTHGAGIDASLASGLRLVAEPAAARSLHRLPDPDGPTWRMLLASVVLSTAITAGLVAWLLA